MKSRILVVGDNSFSVEVNGKTIPGVYSSVPAARAALDKLEKVRKKTEAGASTQLAPNTKVSFNKNNKPSLTIQGVTNVNFHYIDLSNYTTQIEEFRTALRFFESWCADNL